MIVLSDQMKATFLDFHFQIQLNPWLLKIKFTNSE